MTRLPVTRVDSTVLPVSFFDQTPLDIQVLSTGIQSRVLDMCDSLIRTFDIYMSRIYKNKMSALSLYSYTE